MPACIAYAIRRSIEFLQQDIRRADPGGSFDLILCRNAVLTYFMPDEQAQAMQRLAARLRPGGAFVIGVHERLPPSCIDLLPWCGARAIFRAAYASELAPPVRCIARHPDRMMAHDQGAAITLPPLPDA